MSLPQSDDFMCVGLTHGTDQRDLESEKPAPDRHFGGEVERTAMSTATKYQLYTFEEFCDLIPEGQKADLIDGVIYMASPDNVEHSDLDYWLFRVIADFLDEREILGKLCGSRIAFRLGPTGGPEPDLG